MNKKNVIVFDFDGTLADTDCLIKDTIVSTVNEYGHFEVTKDNLESYFGPTESGIIRKVVGERLFPEAWTFFLEDYIRLQGDTIKKVPGMDELLEHLFAKKNLLLLLVTGRSRETTDISLSYLGYEKYFGKVYTGSEEGINKDVSLNQSLIDFGIQKENILYIGDTIADIHTMKKAGIDLISAAYCCKDANVQKQLEKENPGNVVFSTKELTKRLDEIVK